MTDRDKAFLSLEDAAFAMRKSIRSIESIAHHPEVVLRIVNEMLETSDIGDLIPYRLVTTRVTKDQP